MMRIWNSKSCDALRTPTVLAILSHCLVISLLFTTTVRSDEHEGGAADAVEESTGNDGDGSEDTQDSIALTGTLIVMVEVGGDGEDAGDPISGARVSVLIDGAVVSHQDTTNRMGQAEIADLESGRVAVQVVKSGYKSARTKVTIDGESQTITISLRPPSPPEPG